MEKNAWNRQEKLMPLMGRRLKLEKTNNKWFETQDSISYWVVFSHPKTIAFAILICHSKDIKFLRFTNKIHTWSKYYIIAYYHMQLTYAQFQ